MKICSCCKKEKEPDCFYKLVNSKDGFSPRCISCTKISKKEFYKNNKDKVKDSGAKYYQSNKEKVSKRSKDYRKKNIDEIKKKASKYRQNNRYQIKVNRIKSTFGLTLDEYNLISLRFWNEQKGRCAICGLQGTSYGQLTSKDKTTLHLDHCHTTGKIRGLLCTKCNCGIGFFEDNVINLHNACTYLNK